MYFSGLKYTNSVNAGDYIQSIASEQFIPRIKCRFDRDFLKEAPIKKDKYIVITNGWFSHHPEQCFPFSSHIIPLFFGLHIANYHNTWEYVLSDPILDFLRKHEPIGCRDRYTEARLKENGINTYYSRCLTLTFPKRDSTPSKTKYIVVDASHIPLPETISRKSEHFTHRYNKKYTEREKFSLAEQLLDYYREKASVIITTRLHCALPCLAMGIPVVFIGNNPLDYRISILDDIGIKIHKPQEILQLKNWDTLFQSIDFDRIEKTKNHMITDIKQRITCIYEMNSKN